MPKKKIIRFAFFLLLISLYLGASEQNNSTFQFLDYFQSIPIEEQKEIKLLFKDLFFEQAFAYSLFGDKPMSLSRGTLNVYSSDEIVRLLAIDGYCQSVLEPYCDPSNCLQKRWIIWKKHQPKFKMKNFHLLKKSVGGQIRLIFINELSFKTIIDQNINLFRQVINGELSSDTLLEEMKNEDLDMLHLLHNHEGLLGILLGFGRDNSLTFQKREELLDSLGKNLKKPELIQEEIKYLDENLQPFHEHDAYIITSINRVMFLTDPKHPETIQLKRKYDQLERKIKKIFSKNNWFERLLLQLAK